MLKFFLSCVILTVFIGQSLFSFFIQNAEATPKPERISFVSFAPNDWNVYLYLRGPVPIQINDCDGLSYDPVLSPDRRWVVFTSECNGHPHLFIRDLHSMEPSKQLISSHSMEDQAEFSRDGKTLVFVSSESGQTDIYTIPFDPSRVTDISEATRLTFNHGGNFRPVFSPSGKEIAFSSDFEIAPSGPVFNRLRGGNIYLMKSNGSELRKLTQGNEWNGSPTFGTSEHDIYYYSEKGLQEGTRIWGINTKSKVSVPLTSEGKGFALSPFVLPEGSIGYVTSSQSKRLFPMYPAPNGPAVSWKSDWYLTSLPDSNGLVSYPWLSGIRNCWGPKVVSKEGSPAIVCYGPARTVSNPTKSPLPSEQPRVRSGFPVVTELFDRSVQLYSMRGMSAVLHPHRDTMISAEGSGLKFMERCVNNHWERSIYCEETVQEAFHPLSVTSDGKSVLFAKGTLFGCPHDKLEIWKACLSGDTLAERVTPAGDSNNGFLSYAADGVRHVYRSGKSGRFSIFYGDLKGIQHNLTPDEFTNTFPAIAPNGSRVVFSSNREGQIEPGGSHKTFDLFLMDLSEDGEVSNLQKITNEPGHHAHSNFSPDGEWIVYASEQGGLCDEELLIQSIVYNPQMYGEVYAYHISTQQRVRLTHSKWENGIPAWLPAVQ